MRLACGAKSDSKDSCLVMKERIDALEDAIDLVIEELSAQGFSGRKVGGETLIGFLKRVLDEGKPPTEKGEKPCSEK